MEKRECPTCQTDITGAHGKAIYCKSCARERGLADARAWWKRNNYSDVVAKKRERELAIDTT